MKPGNIVTHSGQIINIMSIQPDQVKLFDIATSLAKQCRYNGHCDKFMSVAEHSVRCSYFTHICTNPAALLFHDAAEAYIGDIVRGVKYIKQIHKYIKPLEDAIQAVIWKSLKIQVDPEMMRKVKMVDDILMKTEALQIGMEKAAYYYVNKEAKPEPDLIIEGWPWQTAQREFLVRAGEVLSK